MIFYLTSLHKYNIQIGLVFLVMFNRRMPKYRKSYGIALCRFNDVPEMILVKKRYTYYFFEFVIGKYQKNDNKYLTKLFNNMTYQEKMDILSMRFDTLWYKIWLEIPNTSMNRDAHFIIRNRDLSFNDKKYSYNYIKSKSKFESCFLVDQGIRLKNLIDNSTNAENIWEIPKGRRFPYEKEIDAAVREFREETNIQANKYNILWHVKPLVESYKDAGVIYKTIYYIAALDEQYKNLTPKVRFNSFDQILEVESVKWVNLQEIKMILTNKQTKDRTVKLYTMILDLFKKKCKVK